MSNSPLANPAIETRAAPKRAPSNACLLHANPSPEHRKRATILSISPFQEDHVLLRRIFDESGFNRANWRMYDAQTYPDGLSVLCRDRMTAIICEASLPGGTWKDILSDIAMLVDPPHLIVTSRLADEHLWSEVLNLGGYDVLMKPFSTEEVFRVVGLACLNWDRDRERRTTGPREGPGREPDSQKSLPKKQSAG